ncbi:MAG: MEDS domain-containing protein [Proteobacteria bacterium]|nr:MEDS domain-containing protein [Pseudomonadota bacterium]
MKQKVNDIYFLNLYDVSLCHEGLHMCTFYKSEEEYRKNALDFIHQGSKEHHKIIFITDKAKDFEFLDHFQKKASSLESTNFRTDMVLFTPQEAYYQNGIFSSAKILNFWDEQLEIARKQGYEVVQAIINMDWGVSQFKALDEVIEYESLIVEKLGAQPKLILICQYNLDLFHPGFINKAIESHPLCHIEKEIFPNSYYIAPKQYLSDAREHYLLRQRLHQLKEHRRAEEELSKLYKLTTDLRNFSHMLIHDLKEPIRTASMLNQILKSDHHQELSANALDLIERISHALQEGSNRIEGIKAINFYSKDRKIQIFDLDKILTETLEKHKSIVEKVEGKILCSCLCKIQIKMDIIHFHQIFLNIINNSVKYRKKDVPLLINIRVNINESQRIEIKISDNGTGFKPQYNNHIFHPFRRLHSSHEYEGSGVGLTICQRIMHEYGGEIYAEGEEGVGTTITLRFPPVISETLEESPMLKKAVN